MFGHHLFACLIFGLLAVARLPAGTLVEALDLPADHPVATSGDAPWFAQTDTAHDGLDAAQSGPVGDGQTSSLDLAVTGPCRLDFWWKSSGGLVYLLVDGDYADPMLWGPSQWEGTGVVLLESRPYQIKFVYQGGAGLDQAAWVDQLQLTPLATHRVIFDLGGHAVRIGGGLLDQNVLPGTSAQAPVIDIDPGWVFTGWSADFSVIGADAAITALYTPGAYESEVLVDRYYYRLNSNFGASLAAHGDRLVVGNPNADQGNFDDGKLDEGAAFVWRRGDSSFTQVFPAPGPALAPRDHFGVSVAAIGDLLLVGATGDDQRGLSSGAAYVLSAPAGSVLFRLAPDDLAADAFFGNSVAIDAERFLVGAPGGGGAVYVFARPTGALARRISPPTGANNAYFGARISVSDGILAVGAPGLDAAGTDAGAAYLIDLSDGRVLHRVLPTSATGGEAFGGALALGDHHLVVGARYESSAATDAGAAYVFDRSTGLLLHKLQPGDLRPGDLFGAAIAIKGDYAVIGACGYSPVSDYGTSNTAGAAYVFDLRTGEQVLKLVASDGQVPDRFGCSLAFLDDRLAVGAEWHHTDLGYGDTSTGAVYLFDLNAALGLGSHAVTFDVGAHTTRTGGGALAQTVAYAAPALAPELAVESGWVFVGWDLSFASVTADLAVHALVHRAQSIDFTGPLDDLRKGDTRLLAATADSGLPVFFSVVSGPATLGADGRTLTLAAAGTVIIRATQPGGENNGVTYVAAPAVERTFSVASSTPTKAQTIAFAQPPAATYGAAPLVLAASAGSGLPVSFELVSGPATLSGSTLTLTGAGKVVVRAIQTGNATYKEAAPVIRTLAVDKKPLAVRVAPDFSLARLVGQANRLPSAADLRYDGLVPADAADALGNPKPGVITKAPVVTTKAVAASPGAAHPGRAYPLFLVGGLAANYTFAPGSPFGPLHVVGFGGDYEALLFDPAYTEGSLVPLGKLTLRVSANSLKFTGRIALASAATDLAFTGTLASAAPYASATGATINIPANAKTGSPAYALTGLALAADTLAADLARGAPFADHLVTVEGGSRLADVAAKSASPWAGAYTLILGDPVADLGGGRIPDSRAFPRASGYATGSVAPTTGLLSLSGKLPDGTPLTASAKPDAEGRFRLFVKPHGTRLDSALAGTLDLEPHPDQTRFPGRSHVSREHGLLLWTKAPLPTSTPAAKQDKTHRLGFGPLDLTATLDPWLPPVAATAATQTTPARSAVTLAQRLGLAASPAAPGPFPFGISHGPAELPFGDLLSALPDAASLDARSLVSVASTPADTAAPIANPTAWKMTIKPATGALSGSFTLKDTVVTPATATRPAVAKVVARRVSFSGVLRQRPDLAAETDPLLGSAHFLLAPAGAPATAEQSVGEVQLIAP